MRNARWVVEFNSETARWSCRHYDAPIAREDYPTLSGALLDLMFEAEKVLPREVKLKRD